VGGATVVKGAGLGLVVSGVLGASVAGLLGASVAGLLGGTVLGGTVLGGTVLGGTVLGGTELGGADAVAEPLFEAEDVGSPTGGEDPPVQAEIAAEASRARMAQPTAVNLALSPVPAAALRTFMEPPHASGRWRSRFRKRRGP
jgi:hypothetical protein